MCKLLIVFILSIQPIRLVASSYSQFELLTTKDGLSQTTVFDIKQDSSGFIWIATQQGLNRFDGYDFKIFVHDPADQFSLSDSFINRLFIDSHNRLWIGTRKGLNIFDPNQLRFKPIGNGQSSNLIASKSILSITEDSNGCIWAGTSDGLLFNVCEENNDWLVTLNESFSDHSDKLAISDLSFDKYGTLWLAKSDVYNKNNAKASGLFYKLSSENHFNMLKITTEVESEALSIGAFSILIDPNNIVWVGTYSGQLLQVIKSDSKEQNYHIKQPVVDIGANLGRDVGEITDISSGNDGSIWITTSKGGLVKVNQNLTIAGWYSQTEPSLSNIHSDALETIFTDKSGVLWIGSFNDGLIKHAPSANLIERHLSNVRNNFTKGMTVFAIEPKDLIHYWIATTDQGLLLYNMRDGSTQKVPGLNFQVTGKIISLLSDSFGYLWIGTLGNGLFKYSPSDELITHFKSSDLNKASLSNNILSDNIITFMLEDNDQNIWIATHNGGLNQYDRTTKKIQRWPFNEDKNSRLKYNKISVLLLNDDRLWIGYSGAGIEVIDINKNELHEYYAEGSENGNLCSNNIYDLFLAEDSTLWIATNLGLCKTVKDFKDATKRVTFEKKNDPLKPTGAIGAVLQDQAKNLWLSSVDGIYRYQPNINKFEFFDYNNGTLDGGYFIHGKTVDLSGNFIFNGFNGFSRFIPSETAKDISESSPLITRLHLFDKEVEFSAISKSDEENNSEGFRLSMPIHLTESLTFNYSQAYFSFDFSAMHYANPENNQFAYRLIGLNDKWHFTNAKNRRATFTSIPPGKYEFQLKSSNHNEIWSDYTKNISITILPPPWKTWWAYLLYVLVVLAILFIIHNEKTRVEILKQKRLSAENENRDKSKFLAMVSHEIRNPINGVLGAVNLVRESRDLNEIQSLSKMIKVSSENLLHIVNDILDLSKIKAKKLELDLHQFDLRDCIEQACEIFYTNLEKNAIKLYFLPEDNTPREIVSDSTRLRQIIVNLVSNAIKFTLNGKIFIKVKQVHSKDQEMQLEFRVIDTGEGIPKEKQSSIFKEFTQADASTTRTHGGTGLGLSISQELVNILGGEIKISSQVGVGTEFIFDIKVSKPPAMMSINRLKQPLNLNGKTLIFVGLDKYQQQQILLLEPESEAVFLFQNELDLNVLNSSVLTIVFNVDTAAQLPTSAIIDIKKHKGLNRILIGAIINPGLLSKLSLSEIENFDYKIFSPLELEPTASQIQQLVSSAHSKVEVQETTQEFNPASVKNVRILVADDNAVNQKLLLHTFRKLGFDPDIVSNGFEILTSLEQQKYDVLFTDIEMPGMGGIEAIDILRKKLNNQQLSIIVCSGNNSSSFLEYLDSNKIQGILTKPFGRKEIRSIINKMF